jgi:hypothetical protein
MTCHSTKFTYVISYHQQIEEYVCMTANCLFCVLYRCHLNEGSAHFKLLPNITSGPQIKRFTFVPTQQVPVLFGCGVIVSLLDTWPLIGLLYQARTKMMAVSVGQSVE